MVRLRKIFINISLGLTLLSGIGSVSALSSQADQKLAEVLKGAHRSEDFRARDQYRHPKAVLEFFQVEPSTTAVEIWPGGGYWVEILGPYFRGQGIYYAAGFAVTSERAPNWRKDMQIQLANKLAADPKLYDHVVLTELSVPERTTIAPPGTADRVLTFRNVHNWMKGDYAPGVFKAMYRALKPGGILGVVEHRAKPGTSMGSMIESGYVTEAHVIKLAEQAGFKLVDQSELNANPKDSTEHPAGVWTLPPSFRYCKKQPETKQEECFKKYRAIGESDRMTLKFKKPE